MSGFSNPIVGGGGALVYPSIHSPNYAPGPPVTGWSINKDGSFSFGAGGSITGTLTIYNSHGAVIFEVEPSKDAWFLYADTGSAAQGALLISAASASGTDDFGNAFLAGLTSYGQPVAGTWIACNTSSITGSAFGMTFYSAASPAGPWTLDSWLRRSGSTATQLELGPVTEILNSASLPSTPSSGSKIWSTGGLLSYVGSDGINYAIGHFTSFSTTDQLVNNTAFTDICGGGAVVAASAKYRVHAELTVVQGPNIASNHYRLGFTGTISQVRVKAVQQQDNTSSFVATTTSNNGLLAAHSYGAATTYVVTIHGIITTTSTGTLSVQAAMDAATNTFTVLALSDFHLERIG